MGFLSLQIPEEHDLESQIRKEREWRFLRNTRVRKQAQQVIQKGKCTVLPEEQVFCQIDPAPKAPCVLPLQTSTLTGRGSWDRGGMGEEEATSWGRLLLKDIPALGSHRGKSRLASDLQRSISSALWHFQKGVQALFRPWEPTSH